MSVGWCGYKNRYQNGKCLKEIKLYAHNMITNLDSIVNIIGEPIWPFDEHKNPHFDNEYDIHMSSENYEEGGYSLNLDLQTIFY